jgi:hypothetical protein
MRARLPLIWPEDRLTSVFELSFKTSPLSILSLVLSPSELCNHSYRSEPGWDTYVTEISASAITFSGDIQSACKPSTKEAPHCRH